MLHVSRQQLHVKLQMFTALQNAVTKSELLTVDILQHTCLHAVWFITYDVVKLHSFSKQLLTVNVCN